MGRDSDRKDISNLIIGMLLGLVGWLGNRQLDAIEAKATQIDRHLEYTDGQIAVVRLEIAAIKNIKR